jgi:hypothetical protein
MNGYLEHGDPAEKDQYKTLMKYLKQLRKEGAKFVYWLPEYDKKNIEIVVKVVER